MDKKDFNGRATPVVHRSSGNATGDSCAESKGGFKPNSEVRKIDIYTHFAFERVIEFIENSGGPRPHVFRKLFSSTPSLIDIDQRLQLMDKYGMDMHVLIPFPWIETAPPVHADPKLAAQAAQMCNDELAEIVSKHPERFLGVAVLPTTNTEVMINEFDRAIKELGFVGAYIVVGPTDKRPDHPDFEHLYRRAVELDVPIWLHPSRPENYPDYVDEKMSKYQVWQAFSWLLDSTAAMVRMVFTGLFLRYPTIKIIIHHHGALVPLFADRLETGISYFEAASGECVTDLPISKPYINHFKNFYCDTATQGFSPLILQNAYEFFGADHMLFGTDSPMDVKSGGIYTPEAERTLEALDISETDREKIYSGNAIKLLM